MFYLFIYLFVLFSKIRLLTSKAQTLFFCVRTLYSNEEASKRVVSSQKLLGKNKCFRNLRLLFSDFAAPMNAQQPWAVFDEFPNTTSRLSFEWLLLKKWVDILFPFNNSDASDHCVPYVSARPPFIHQQPFPTVPSSQPLTSSALVVVTNNDQLISNVSLFPNSCCPRIQKMLIVPRCKEW